ncbi:MAG: DNA polymerase I, partial [Chitinophagaceae bacterium]|nr:DNA polymerase I [Chitinophagaceae bacterium]
MQKKLFLLDAYALIFRAYYALIRSPRITSKGRNTNAQFGFTNTLLDLLNNQKPTHIAVCFDTAEATERHTDFADYKANRQETPEDIKDAVPDIQKIISGFNIPIIAIDGYEADDVIGALAKKAEKNGFEVYMVTPDKDYGQLVSEKIKIYKPAYQGGSFEILGPREVCEKWDIETVDQVIDMLGLMGDAVDNIPGIKGVGEKTAAKLLKEYQTLENVLINADKIKGALGEKIRSGKEDALMSKKLATILLNVPIEFDESQFAIKEKSKEALLEIFEQLEFKTLAKRVLGEEIKLTASTESKEAAQMDLFGNTVEVTAPSLIENKPQPSETGEETFFAQKNINNTNHHYTVATAKEVVAALKNSKEICFDSETTGIDPNQAKLVGLSFSISAGSGWYIPCPDDTDAVNKILQDLKPVFEDVKKIWIGQNIKYDMLMLKW